MYVKQIWKYVYVGSMSTPRNHHVQTDVKSLVKTHRKLEAMLNSDFKELPRWNPMDPKGGFNHK